MGDSTRTCQATRVWSGSAPTCQRMLLFNFEHEVAKVCQTLLCLHNLGTRVRKLAVSEHLNVKDYCFFVHMQGSITVYFNYTFLELSFVMNGW